MSPVIPGLHRIVGLCSGDQILREFPPQRLAGKAHAYSHLRRYTFEGLYLYFGRREDNPDGKIVVVRVERGKRQMVEMFKLNQFIWGNELNFPHFVVLTTFNPV
jgi:hypothetical protein